MESIKLENWQNSCSQKTQNKLLQRKKTIEPWKHLSHLNHSKEIMTTRFCIRHTKLTRNHLFEKTPKPNCQFYNTEQITVKHLLFQCNNLKTIRSKQNIPENFEPFSMNLSKPPKSSLLPNRTQVNISDLDLPSTACISHGNYTHPV